jgi:hypothetical protein
MVRVSQKLNGECFYHLDIFAQNAGMPLSLHGFLPSVVYALHLKYFLLGQLLRRRQAGSVKNIQLPEKITDLVFQG